MLALLLLQQPESTGQVAEIARTFGVAWPHLIAQTISFILVCALLYWLAYRPILRMLDARRQQIADGLANAEPDNMRLKGGRTYVYWTTSYRLQATGSELPASGYWPGDQCVIA